MSLPARLAVIVTLALGTCLLRPGAGDMLVGASGEALAAPATGPATPAATEPTAPPLSRAITRRLELWRSAGTGADLSARYRLTRRSSLLDEPLAVTGSLSFTAPDRLELRDDEATGATTSLIGAALTITANDPALPAGPTRAAETAAARWLQTRLLILLAARDPAALRAGTSLRVSYGYGLMGLELSPPAGHPARGEVHDLRVQLDPKSGEILQIVLGETSGDVVTLSLSEHRRGPAS